MGLIHAFVWMRQGSRAHLAFAFAALSVAALTLLELHALRATDPDQLGTLLRWMHVPVTVLVLSIVWFLHERLGGGYLGLGLAAAGLRVLGLVLNFTTGENLNFRTLEVVRQVQWWGGEQVSYGAGTVNPWVAVAQLSNPGADRLHRDEDDPGLAPGRRRTGPGGAGHRRKLAVLHPGDGRCGGVDDARTDQGALPGVAELPGGRRRDQLPARQ
ncbi:hypothetical protein [Arenimonas daejeonensis]|uniref:hypothetical protein n=1 Tax=Arenimonas daejeonensis TaxID=370777 RepID=UPI001D133B8A|nr:hypothetical protein [Arenimonas daejeonensis]